MHCAQRWKEGLSSSPEPAPTGNRRWDGLGAALGTERQLSANREVVSSLGSLKNFLQTETLDSFPEGAPGGLAKRRSFLCPLGLFKSCEFSRCYFVLL